MSLFPNISFRLEVVDEIDSTNAALLERFQSEDISGTALLALRQKAGIGRRGRSWETLSGNLALSYAITLNASHPVALLSFVTGIALYATAQSYLGAEAELGLKWPNDLYLNGRKLAGMLVQARQQGESVKVVVGIGLNLREKPEMEEGTSAFADLLPMGQIPEPEDFAQRFLRQLEIAFQRCESFSDVKKEWSVRCAHLNRPIYYLQDATVKTAVARELLASGELLVEEAGGKKALSSEEVSLRLVL